MMAFEKAREFEFILPESKRDDFLLECIEVANVASFLNSLAGAFQHASEDNRDIRMVFQVTPARTNVIPFQKQPEVPVEPKEEEPLGPPACFRPLPDTMPPDVRAELEKLIAYIERDGKPIA